jgi:hypothetical protein
MSKKNTPISGGEGAQRLIEAAAKQPGITELVRVYQTWQRFDQVLDMQRQLTATKRVVSTSISSAPALSCAS